MGVLKDFATYYVVRTRQSRGHTACLVTYYEPISFGRVSPGTAGTSEGLNTCSHTRFNFYLEMFTS